MLSCIGARLDHQPELLFRLRGVDEKELIVAVSKSIPLTRKVTASHNVFADENPAYIFGLDMAQSAGLGAGTGDDKRAKPQGISKAVAPNDATTHKSKKTGATIGGDLVVAES